MHKIVRNQRGMSLIEVIISGAMALIISMGVASMMQNSFKEQRRIVLLDTLRNQKVRFDTMLRDQSIWNATMNNNVGAPFTTLKTGATTPAIADTAPVEFQFYNAGSPATLAFDLLSNADVTGPYNGFTEKGATCTNFYMTVGQGKDDCPFSYRLLVAAVCSTSSPATCTNPQLKLVARLLFNPAVGGSLANFVNQINPVTGNSIADSVIDSKYDSVVKRTATAVNRSFKIVSGFIPSAGSCATGGVGTCTQSLTVPALHPLTNGGTSDTGKWTDDSAHGGFDPYDLVNPNNGSGAFRFNETGYYGCIISVPAFATSGFEASLYDTTNSRTIAVAAVSAGLWVQATAVIDAKFNVTSTTTDFKLYQRCDSLPGGSPSANACTLGFSTTYPGTFISFLSMSCYKIDRAL